MNSGEPAFQEHQVFAVQAGAQVTAQVGEVATQVAYVPTQVAYVLAQVT